MYLKGARVVTLTVYNESFSVYQLGQMFIKTRFCQNSNLPSSDEWRAEAISIVIYRRCRSVSSNQETEVRQFRPFHVHDWLKC